jgi:protein-tyrosine sulfotransferase
VIKPVNLEALTKWVGHIPEDVVNEMANIAPMLSILGKNNFIHVLYIYVYHVVIFYSGYDPYANPPNYGSAADVVKENTNQVKNDDKSFFVTSAV